MLLICDILSLGPYENAKRLYPDLQRSVQQVIDTFKTATTRGLHVYDPQAQDFQRFLAKANEFFAVNIEMLNQLLLFADQKDEVYKLPDIPAGFDVGDPSKRDHQLCIPVR
jgi:hypothetical protein